MAKLEEREFQQRIGRVEGLIQQIDQLADTAGRAMLKDLVQALLDLHGTSLERMLEITYQTGAAGQVIIDNLGQDELVGNLLILHGLHPFDLETRVRQALDKVRPYLSSHGGNVDLLGVTNEGAVRLRLEGSCQGCPSSQVTLKYAIEDAIYKAAPDVTAIQVDGAVESQPAFPAGFVPMSELLGAETNAASWVTVDGLTGIETGAPRTVAVSGQSVLFCRVDETLYAYGNTCPHCGQLLGLAKLAGKDLICAACGHRYDLLHAGRNLDEPKLHLAPFPLLEERSQSRLRYPILDFTIAIGNDSATPPYPSPD